MIYDARTSANSAGKDTRLTLESVACHSDHIAGRKWTCRNKTPTLACTCVIRIKAGFKRLLMRTSKVVLDTYGINPCDAAWSSGQV